jgi:putative FmdB family regulatory protein
MPTYDYRCPNGHDFELFRKMSDDPEASCPECGEPAERLISGGTGYLKSESMSKGEPPHGPKDLTTRG